MDAGRRFLDDAVALLPTPEARLSHAGGPDYARANRPRSGGIDLNTAVALELLPTPRATDGTKGGPNQRGSSGDLTMPSVAVRLLPTPTVSQGRNSTSGRQPDAKFNSGETLQDVAYASRWGKYGPAIERWESITRPAPGPTVQGPRGGERLNPAFVEWMMGLPEGWVTSVPGLTRNQQLKLLGNGVVPQQAAAAYEALLSTTENKERLAA